MGSSKNTAASLAVTPSAVSHQIHHLEDWLGAPLFDCRGGRPRLLPRGEEFARTSRSRSSMSTLPVSECAGPRDRRRSLGLPYPP
jgi:DNA-binding transcriptional LysR family regulator